MANTILVVLVGPPYDGSDRTWNALRFCEKALEQGAHVRLFLMNEAVDLARRSAGSAEQEFDLQKMIADLVALGAELKLCTTCITRCGIGELAPGFEACKSNMQEFYDWVISADKVLTF